MTKELFLKILKDGLKDLPQSVLGNILFDYKERFAEGLKLGKSEDEIAHELGDPYDIVSLFKEKYLNNNENPTNIKIEDNDKTQIICSNFSNNNESNNFNDNTYVKPKKKDNRNTSNLILSIVIVVIGLFLFGPLALGGLVCIGAICFSVFVAVCAGGAASVLLLLIKNTSLTFGITAPGFILDFPNSVIVLSALGCLLLLIFFVICIYYIIKVFCKLIKRFLLLIIRNSKEAE